MAWRRRGAGRGSGGRVTLQRAAGRHHGAGQAALAPCPSSSASHLSCSAKQRHSTGLFVHCSPPLPPLSCCLQDYSEVKVVLRLPKAPAAPRPHPQYGSTEDMAALIEQLQVGGPPGLRPGATGGSRCGLWGQGRRGRGRAGELRTKRTQKKESAWLPLLPALSPGPDPESALSPTGPASQSQVLHPYLERCRRSWWLRSASGSSPRARCSGRWAHTGQKG